MPFEKTTRINRFRRDKTSRKTEEYNSFSFGKSLKSYNSSNLMFTNFVKSKNNENYLRLEDIVIRSLYKDYDFIEQDFENLDEVQYTQETASRLLNIINKGYKHKYKEEDFIHIFKMKHKSNSKFQLYVYKSRKNLNVILIDFFHLAIPSDKYTNNSVIKLELSKLYNKQLTNSWDIRNIIQDSSS